VYGVCVCVCVCVCVRVYARVRVFMLSGGKAKMLTVFFFTFLQESGKQMRLCNKQLFLEFIQLFKFKKTMK